MVEQNNANAYLQTEVKLKEFLSGERLKNASDFVAYLKESGRTCELSSNHPSSIFKYMDEYSCLVIYEKDDENPMGRWFICCWRNNCDVCEHENFPADKNLKEFAQNNIHKCFNCGGCKSHGLGPTRISVFEKEYENVCSDVFHFYSPESENLKNVINLMELQKHIITDLKNRLKMFLISIHPSLMKTLCLMRIWDSKGAKPLWSLWVRGAAFSTVAFPTAAGGRGREERQGPSLILRRVALATKTEF